MTKKNIKNPVFLFRVPIILSIPLFATIIAALITLLFVYTTFFSQKLIVFCLVFLIFFGAMFFWVKKLLKPIRMLASIQSADQIKQLITCSPDNEIGDLLRKFYEILLNKENKKN